MMRQSNNAGMSIWANRALLILLFLIVQVYSGLSQNLAEPVLLGTWVPENEDYGEFIYHRLERVKFEYLENSRHGTVVARICSPDKFPVALVTSPGFAFQLTTYAAYLRIPKDKIFLASYSKCGYKSEQYWFVPEKATLDYDQKISAEHVEVNRWLVSYSNQPKSKAAEEEFRAFTKEFISTLKNNPEAKGFVIRNLGMSTRLFNNAVLQVAKVVPQKDRVQVVRKRRYNNYYPEFMVVSVKALKQTQ